MIELHSALDPSVNFIESALVGFTEARYVRKSKDYFICYLSSQTGCNRGCTFCHLTATKQTRFEDVSEVGLVAQARIIFEHYRRQRRARYMHYNFMARGEPLANAFILDDSTTILTSLGRVAVEHDLFARFNISTIMPMTMKQPLTAVFPVVHPTIYYSIYSVDPTWRKAWLPAAMDVTDALRMLREYQILSKKTVKLHGAFIAGENDSADHVGAMLDAVEKAGLEAEFNVVRYNPASEAQGRETVDLQRIVEQIGRQMPVKVIPRVGPDAYASCGTFYER